MEKGANKSEVAALTMWEIRPLEFIFVCISNRVAKDEKEPINNNYIYDVKSKNLR